MGGVGTVTGTRQSHGQVQDDPPLFDEEDAVGQSDGFLDIVCDQEDRPPVTLPESGDQPLHLQPRQSVERPQRLIQ